MSIELMLNAVNLSFVTFAYQWHEVRGQIFVFFVMMVAAAEAAVGLAITIAISTVISAFSSLTLSPALCAVLLKDHHAPKDWFSRLMEKSLGWFFGPFNRIFAWAGEKYSAGVGKVLRKSVVALVVYGGLVALTALGF